MIEENYIPIFDDDDHHLCGCNSSIHLRILVTVNLQAKLIHY